MPAMTLTETTISGTAVRMRYADHADPARATSWVDIQMPLAELKHPSPGEKPLGDPEYQFLGEVRLATLRAARDVIAGETQRLSAQTGRNR